MLTNVLTLHLKSTFPPMIWIFTEGEGDGIFLNLFYLLTFNYLFFITEAATDIIQKVEARRGFKTHAWYLQMWLFYKRYNWISKTCIQKWKSISAQTQRSSMEKLHLTVTI